MREKTGKNIHFKGLFHLIRNDRNKHLLKYFFKKPFSNSLLFIKAYLGKRPYFMQLEELFFYGLKDIEEFKKNLGEKTHLIIGFSYCQRPKNCPIKRFSNLCNFSKKNSTCQNCLIGKFFQAREKENSTILIISTVNYIAEEIIKIQNKHPSKKILFVISACEMSLKMFEPNAQALNLQGIGIKLFGRVCEHLKTFYLAEKGKKITTTHLNERSEQFFIELLNTLSLPKKMKY